MATSPSATSHPSIRSEGGLIGPELLDRLATGRDLDGLEPADYGLHPRDRIRDVIELRWRRVQTYWAEFKLVRDRLDESDTGVTETRERWLLKLLEELGYDRVVFRQSPEIIDNRPFPISHRSLPRETPIHLISFRRTSLDRREARNPSPHSLLQEYLNRSPLHEWGIVSNGVQLRLLRDNASLARAAHLEFDLEAMLEGNLYPDFVLLWLVAHRTRLIEGPTPDQCWLERWRREAAETGSRAMSRMRGGVREAIRLLGQGFIDHPENVELNMRLADGSLSTRAYYAELLRVVYRLLFLQTAEDRDLIFAAGVAPAARSRYEAHYSLDRLRRVARRRRGDPRYDDAWRGLQVTFQAMREVRVAKEFGIKPLGGGLFGNDSCPNLDAAQIDNAALLGTIRSLTTFEDGAGKSRRNVNFREMDTEELGSVYEGLLEFEPRLSTSAGKRFELIDTSGQRKETGSYYTDSGLVRELIVSALDPVIKEAVRRGADAKAKADELLDIKVCDPSCGSGHFLLAAARKIGLELARVRGGDVEPDPESVRHAIREVINHCVYGVDLNPQAVDLCRLALWLEAHEPGKPLGFIEAHVRHGNALVGVPIGFDVWKDAIPDEAFTVAIGDDKAVAARVRERNKGERRRISEVGAGQMPMVQVRPIATRADRDFSKVMEVDDESLADVDAKRAAFRRRETDPAVVAARIVADLWTAAFFWHLVEGGSLEPTTGLVQRLATEDVSRYVDKRRNADLAGGSEHQTIKEARRLRREHAFLHWEIEFPEVFSESDEPGFDCVLGNPPWDSLSPDAKEFFAAYNPQVRFQSPVGQKALIAELTADPIVSARWDEHCRTLYKQATYFKQSGRYRLFAPGNLGKGDFNVYRVFIETALQTAREGGTVSQLVPEGFYNGANAMAIRQELFGSTELRQIVSFENAKRFWFPDNHASLKFCFYVARLGGRTESIEASFSVKSLDDLAQAAERPLSIPISIIREFSPDALAIMEFSSQAEIDIVAKMYSRWPKFGERVEGSPHRHYMAEIHMGNDRSLFTDDPSGLPVYEGRMVDHYDHRAKGYRSGRGRSAVWEDLPFDSLSKSIQPQWYIERTRLPTKLGDRVDRFRACFCDVASPTNVRALVGTVVPPGVVCGHSVPTVLFTEEPADWRLIPWVAVANSTVMDYLARKKISLHMTITVVDSLPFPRLELGDPVLDQLAPRVLKLLAAADEMLPYWNGMSRFGWVEPCDEDRSLSIQHPDDRQRVQAEVDALVARKLFDLTRGEYEHVLDNFATLKREDNRHFGEFRTKRLCLAAYDELEGIT